MLKQLISLAFTFFSSFFSFLLVYYKTHIQSGEVGKGCILAQTGLSNFEMVQKQLLWNWTKIKPGSFILRQQYNYDFFHPKAGTPSPYLSTFEDLPPPLFSKSGSNEVFFTPRLSAMVDHFQIICSRIEYFSKISTFKGFLFLIFHVKLNIIIHILEVWNSNICFFKVNNEKNNLCDFLCYGH